MWPLRVMTGEPHNVDHADLRTSLAYIRNRDRPNESPAHALKY